VGERSASDLYRGGAGGKDLHDRDLRSRREQRERVARPDRSVLELAHAVDLLRGNPSQISILMRNPSQISILMRRNTLKTRLKHVRDAARTLPSRAIRGAQPRRGPPASGGGGGARNALGPGTGRASPSRYFSLIGIRTGLSPPRAATSRESSASSKVGPCARTRLRIAMVHSGSPKHPLALTPPPPRRVHLVRGEGRDLSG